MASVEHDLRLIRAHAYLEELFKGFCAPLSTISSWLDPMKALVTGSVAVKACFPELPFMWNDLDIFTSNEVSGAMVRERFLESGWTETVDEPDTIFYVRRYFQSSKFRHPACPVPVNVIIMSQNLLPEDVDPNEVPFFRNSFDIDGCRTCWDGKRVYPGIANLETFFERQWSYSQFNADPVRLAKYRAHGFTLTPRYPDISEEEARLTTAERCSKAAMDLGEPMPLLPWTSSPKRPLEETDEDSNKRQHREDEDEDEGTRRALLERPVVNILREVLRSDDERENELFDEGLELFGAAQSAILFLKGCNSNELDYIQEAVGQQRKDIKDCLEDLQAIHPIIQEIEPDSSSRIGQWLNQQMLRCAIFMKVRAINTLCIPLPSGYYSAQGYVKALESFVLRIKKTQNLPEDITFTVSVDNHQLKLTSSH